MATTKPVALIAGAAAHGVGEGIVRRHAHEGHDVALLDINASRCSIPLDVGEPRDMPRWSHSFCYRMQDSSQGRTSSSTAA